MHREPHLRGRERPRKPGGKVAILAPPDARIVVDDEIDMILRAILRETT